MDIRALGAVAARIGMGLAGNAKVAITLKLGYTSTSSTYDPATDTMTNSTGQDIAVSALKYQRKNSQKPTDQVNDKQFSEYSHTYLIEAADLDGATILETDTVIEGGTTFAIITAKIDPAQAAWIVEVRR